jgi:cytochrome c
MKSVAIALGLVAALLPWRAAQAQDAAALLQKYDCTICHGNDEAGAGPAYIDIAEKYRGNKQAAATLRAVIRKGEHGGGPWNMPPFPQVPGADAEKMAQYILSLQK